MEDNYGVGLLQACSVVCNIHCLKLLQGHGIMSPTEQAKESMCINAVEHVEKEKQSAFIDYLHKSYGWDVHAIYAEATEDEEF